MVTVLYNNIVSGEATITVLYNDIGIFLVNDMETTSLLLKTGFLVFFSFWDRVDFVLNIRSELIWDLDNLKKFPL